MLSIRIAGFILMSLLASISYAAVPTTPKVERVRPLATAAPDSVPGVFFYENLETLTDLSERFQDISLNNGHFGITGLDPFSGSRSIQQEYLPLNEVTWPDSGSAGWVTRFTGDSPTGVSKIPAEEQHPVTTLVANWYHKFEEGFQPRDGLYPNKNARMRCYQPSYVAAYSILYWTGDTDGHISIENHTKAPGAYREWLPNHYANFFYSDPQNIGRWIHYELRVSLGEGRKADRVQAWADGMLICDMAGMDLASGYREYTLNAMMWDCYWNGGSPKRQNRFFDDLVLSTQPVGPARTGFNPVIVKSAFRSAQAGAVQGGWEVEVAEGVQKPMRVASTVDALVTRYEKPELDCTVVWRGAVNGAGNTVSVDTLNGRFAGPRQGQGFLGPNALHFVRIRQRDSAGAWSAWSGWHSGFATQWTAGTPQAQRLTPTGYMTETPAAVLDADSVAPRFEEAQPLGNAFNASGYEINARVNDDHLMEVYVYYRLDPDSTYKRVQMTPGNGGAYTGRIPGQALGSVVKYYLRARDFRWNTTFMPSNYDSSPWSFRVLNGDVNGDGKLGMIDILCLILRGTKSPLDQTLDLNGDGAFSCKDAVILARDIVGLKNR